MYQLEPKWDWPIWNVKRKYQVKPKRHGPTWDVAKTYDWDLGFIKMKSLIAWTIYFHINRILFFNRIFETQLTLSLCQDDFFPYENPLKHIHQDDQLTFCSILMLNTVLKTPFTTARAETSTWRRNLYVNETDLFVTSLWRLIGTKIKPGNLRRRSNAPIDT